MECISLCVGGSDHVGKNSMHKTSFEVLRIFLKN
jgi:hypothetical protein